MPNPQDEQVPIYQEYAVNYKKRFAEMPYNMIFDCKNDLNQRVLMNHPENNDQNKNIFISRDKHNACLEIALIQEVLMEKKNNDPNLLKSIVTNHKLHINNNPYYTHMDPKTQSMYGSVANKLLYSLDKIDSLSPNDNRKFINNHATNLRQVSSHQFKQTNDNILTSLISGKEPVLSYYK